MSTDDAATDTIVYRLRTSGDDISEWVSPPFDTIEEAHDFLSNFILILPAKNIELVRLDTDSDNEDGDVESISSVTDFPWLV